MSRTYKATGINLKSMPLGESDRLLTILTPEYGLIRAVAPGARKPRSQIGGRAALFVVNELLLSKGRTLDKLSQAETVHTYAGLTKNLATLTAAQYLVELVLYQALSEQPQKELFTLLCWQLTRLEQAAVAAVLPELTLSVYRLLVWSGIAPQVKACVMTQRLLEPNFTDPDWRVGFSLMAGGVICSTELSSQSQTCVSLTATELDLLQQMANAAAEPPGADDLPIALNFPTCVWLAVERILRRYAQYHVDRPIRSAMLIESCFSPLPTAS
jgi:DNA repair protein RecO (recombination protein O)